MSQDALTPPAGITVKELGRTLRVTVAWSRRRRVVGATLLLFGLSMAAAAAMRPPQPETEWAGLALWVALAVAAAYAGVAGLVNSTVLLAERDELRVFPWPLPWAGRRSVRLKKLKQLYCTTSREIVEASVSRYGPTDSIALQRYHMIALTTEDEIVPLVPNMVSRHQARFLEAKFESFLGIENVPGRGELGKPKPRG